MDANGIVYQDPDQESRRAELRDFFGPNADVFLRTYDRMRAITIAPAGSKSFFERWRVSGFEPAAFFCGPVWFFYRKMWGWAWGITALMAVLSILSSVLHLRSGFAFGAVLGVLGHRAYVQHAIATLARMRRADGTLDVADVREAGGVSKLAGWLSGTVYALLIALTIVGLILLFRHPEAAGGGL